MSTPMLASISSFVLFALPLLVTNIRKPLFRQLSPGRAGGFAALESPDGKFLYYAKGPTAPGLWRIPTDGGEESEVISSLEPVTGAIGQ